MSTWTLTSLVSIIFSKTLQIVTQCLVPLQLSYCLEGIKAGLDVYARLCVLSSEEATPSFWWSSDQLKQLCSSWELCLHDLTASSFGEAETHKNAKFNEVLLLYLVYKNYYSINIYLISYSY